jgi:alkanesulfonate monooxygenase
MMLKPPIKIFSTCPQSTAASGESYVRRVAETARWSDENGFEGILIYTDNSLIDPWLLSQIVLQSSDSLCPLVAVQPVYAHPYTVAKMVASYGHLYSRRVYLNMLAGGFKNDLEALGDTTGHDRRYDRMIEYTTIIMRLLESSSPVTYQGEFYSVDRLRMTPSLPGELLPGILVSGSSDAGLAAARAVGATAIKYPKPAADYPHGLATELAGCGIRVGIIARETGDEAWQIARERFPEDRKGQITHQLAMKVSDSVWHRQLSEMGTISDRHDSAYWLGPFMNYNTFCPYLVGSYETVADELARYMSLGADTFILDIPPSREELQHSKLVFGMALQEVAG